jgi:hypothetical protein
LKKQNLNGPLFAPCARIAGFSFLTTESRRLKQERSPSMNASPRPPTCPCGAPAVDFLTLLPTIQRHFGYAFRRIPKPSRQDVLQEALVAAFIFYRRLIARRRRDQIFASPLGRYAVFHVRNGRRVGSPKNGADVSCPFVARRRGFRVEPIDRFERGARRWTLMAVPSSSTPIPDQVAFRLDFPQWLSTQSLRNRRLIQALGRGDTTSEAARQFRISAGRVAQLRSQFAKSWRAFQGETQETSVTAAA